MVLPVKKTGQAVYGGSLMKLHFQIVVF